MIDDVSRKSLRQYARFFGDLGTRMEDARRADHRRYLQFFAELSPRLDTAKALDEDLDRHLALRFNVFDYLDTFEAGLSRIIADLLNPKARHGQRTLFLATLLEELPEIRDLPDLGAAAAGPISVVRERVITGRRRLDISVEIPDGDGRFCLAIENKPYAGDQPNQVKDYLAYLEREYSKRFLLIYLSPTGEAPDESSLLRGDLGQWHGRFAIMPYRGASDNEESEETPDDVFDDFRVELSLANWFAACRRQCDPDRLRWFLRDAEAFCQRRFGGHSMPSDSETRALREYLFSNPHQLATAQAVYDVWPSIKAHVCERFLEHLRTTIGKRVEGELGDDSANIRVECAYDRGRKRYSYIWLYRLGWRPWENHTSEPPFEGCTAILMQGFGPGPSNWIRGVRHPLHEDNLTDSDAVRRARLTEKLRRHLDPCESREWWPYLCRVSDDKANWDALIPELCREWNDGGGQITDYYVDGLMAIATKAIPIIDEVELK